MESESNVVWTVVEASDAGDTLVGVYTTLEKARAIVSRLAQDRLQDYRIEGHVLDSGKEEPTPWQVRLSREGEHLETALFIGCSCGDDEVEMLRRSFISEGGEEMSVVAFAATPGLAISAAQRYRDWLLTHELWTSQPQQLEPILAAI